MKKACQKTRQYILLIPVALVVGIMLICACGTESASSAQRDYGVFLSYEGDLTDLADYRTVVIDAQYIEAEDIRAFQAQGHTVYSYINVGALEDFRDYYDEYKDLALGSYEHWDEEIWIDTADEQWQTFVVDELAAGLKEKGIDGFFADNCDVFYHYPTEEILDGTAAIMKGLRADDMPVLINGGDTFMDAYCKDGRDPKDVATGINQETVFSSILWDEDRFGTADPEDHAYFMDYVERYAELGLDIYLLEYTKDQELAAEIADYCDQKGFRYYISGSLELEKE